VIVAWCSLSSSRTIGRPRPGAALVPSRALSSRVNRSKTRSDPPWNARAVVGHGQPYDVVSGSVTSDRHASGRVPDRVRDQVFDHPAERHRIARRPDRTVGREPDRSAGLGISVHRYPGDRGQVDRLDGLQPRIALIRPGEQQ